MNNLTNTIEFNYEAFTLEVNYNWRRGNAGDYFNAPEENAVDINKITIIAFTNEDGTIEVMNLNWEESIMPNSVLSAIEEEITFDIENFI
jgi:hypothetical protein